MSSSERSIPHLRDIFGLSGSSGYNNQLHSSNNISQYSNHHHHHHPANNNYQNGNGNLVNYNNSVGNNTNNTNTSDINEHSSYGTYDHHNSHLNNQQMIDSNALNNNNINKKNSKKKRDNSKTLTSGDVKTLERHLSMKKTIRKKIMRDLQQAFVEDPNEFRIENINQEQLKAEIRADAFRFGATTGDHQKPSRKSDNFLDMLRGEKSNTTSQQQQQPQLQPQQQQPPPQQLQHHQQQQQYQHSTTTSSTTHSNNNYNDYVNGSNREYDYDSQPTHTTEKQSFWRRFTMKNKGKR